MENRDKLKEILSRDEYTDYHHHANGVRFWDFIKPFFHWLRGLFPDFNAPSDSVISVFTYTLIAVLVGIVIFAMYWFVKQIIRPNKVDRHRSFLPMDGENQSYAYYWTQASEFDALSNWRDGVRAVFLALVFYLDDQQRIKVEKWKTNWEYASELADSRDGLVSLFHDCSSLFERTWYGNETVDQEEFHLIYARVEQVIGKGEVIRHA